MALIVRVWRNLFGGWMQLPRHFPATLLDEVSALVAKGEKTHRGEIRVAIEARLSPLGVLGGQTVRARAEEVFCRLRVWDTEHNNGVLLYILLAERRIEIVVDRGIARYVDEAAWKDICQAMLARFAHQDWRLGLIEGVTSTQRLLAEYFPAAGSKHRDELPDDPVIL
ncbi:TPM domain-containing protein [Dyella sp.]|uniref:TPM domain-containing protein n=1 Tax=Dyella sp. TaxID=1869338 RepID=UPI002ED047BE